MTIDLYAIVLLFSAALATLLAVLAIAVGRWESGMVRAFVLHSTATAFWAAGHFLEQAVLGGADGALFPIGSTGWWIYLVRAAGMIASPIVWFVLCVRTSHNGTFPGWLKAPLSLFFFLTFAVAVTNPATGLLVSEGQGGLPEVGLLTPPLLAVSFFLAAVGTVILVRTRWRQGSGARVSAVVIAVAVVLPMIGGTAWSLRGLLGGPLAVDYAPLLFPLLNLVLLNDVLRHGFANIVPIAAARAFTSMSDIAIVVDTDMVITEVNDAAQRELPAAAVGTPLEGSVPGLAEHARARLRGDRSHGAFELRHEGSVYEGSTHLTGAPGKRSTGCIILLADVTELRRAHEHLELLASSDADAVSLRTPY